MFICVCGRGWWCGVDAGVRHGGSTTRCWPAGTVTRSRRWCVLGEEREGEVGNRGKIAMFDFACSCVFVNLSSPSYAS